jgi:hypothetical protein
VLLFLNPEESRLTLQKLRANPPRLRNLQSRASPKTLRRNQTAQPNHGRRPKNTRFRVARD